MADYIRPTPRNPILGLLADAMMGGLAYMEDPRRTQQMRGVGGLLADTGLAQTVERLAYGEPLTTGKGFATQMKPETANALMTLGPEAVPIGRAAMAGVRATKGLPVGASITGETLPVLKAMTKEQFLGKPKIVGKSDAADLRPIELKSLENAEKVPFLGKYTAKFSEDGAVVFDDGRPIASYNFGDTLTVDKKYRGKGIGEELVYQWRTEYPAPAAASTRNKMSQSLQEKVWDRIQQDIPKFEEQFNGGLLSP